MSTEKYIINTLLVAWRKELVLLGKIVDSSLEFVDKMQKAADGLEEEGEADEGTA